MIIPAVLAKLFVRKSREPEIRILSAMSRLGNSSERLIGWLSASGRPR